MYSLINRNLIWPLYYKLKSDQRIQRSKEIEKIQWCSKDEIISRQFSGFKKMVRYAYENTPFYKELYDKDKVSLEDIQRPEDARYLPILTKKMLQENLEKLTSTACMESQRLQDASGGSTGKPTIFYMDKNTIHMRFAAFLFFDQWTDWKIGEKVAYFWGADRDLDVNFFRKVDSDYLKDLKAHLVEKFVWRQYTLNSFSITESKMFDFARRLRRIKPELIVAYTNSAYQFAKYLKENRINDISPKGIVCSAETLTEEKRNLIEEVFNCKVLNRYGSRETGLIASECKAQEGLHINASDLFVEIDNSRVPNNTDGSGEVIVTDLNNFVMPMIRYNMEDLATPVDKICSCGRGLPLIGKVKGRTSDFIVHPDGRLIHGEFFSHAFYHIPGISQFQIKQNKLNLIEIVIVPNQYYTLEDKKKIMHNLQETMGSEVEIQLNEVKEIPMPPSGKFQFAISNIVE